MGYFFLYLGFYFPRSLLKILPDRGKKVHTFAEKLKQMIQDRLSEKKQKTSQHAHPSNLLPNALVSDIKEHTYPTSDLHEKGLTQNETESVIDALVNRNEENIIKTQNDESRQAYSKSDDLFVDVYELSSNLQVSFSLI